MPIMLDIGRIRYLQSWPFLIVTKQAYESPVRISWPLLSVIIEQGLATLDFLETQIYAAEDKLEAFMQVSVEADLLKTLPRVAPTLIVLNQRRIAGTQWSGCINESNAPGITRRR
jgi:hypothetical protein